MDRQNSGSISLGRSQSGVSQARMQVNQSNPTRQNYTPDLSVAMHMENIKLLRGNRDFYTNGQVLKPENRHVEYKKAQGNIVSFDYQKDTIAKNICAFLNSDGGTLILGVSDDCKVIGIEWSYKLKTYFEYTLDACVRNIYPGVSKGTMYKMHLRDVLENPSNPSSNPSNNLKVVEIIVAQGDRYELYRHIEVLDEAYVRREASVQTTKPHEIPELIQQRNVKGITSELAKLHNELFQIQASMGKFHLDVKQRVATSQDVQKIRDTVKSLMEKTEEIKKKKLPGMIDSVSKEINTLTKTLDDDLKQLETAAAGMEALEKETKEKAKVEFAKLEAFCAQRFNEMSAKVKKSSDDMKVVYGKIRENINANTETNNALSQQTLALSQTAEKLVSQVRQLDQKARDIEEAQKRISKEAREFVANQKAFTDARQKEINELYKRQEEINKKHQEDVNLFKSMVKRNRNATGQITATAQNLERAVKEIQENDIPEWISLTNTMAQTKNGVAQVDEDCKKIRAKSEKVRRAQGTISAENVRYSHEFSRKITTGKEEAQRETARDNRYLIDTDNLANQDITVWANQNGIHGF